MNKRKSKKERDQMTMNTRKHMPSSHQLEGERVMFAQNAKSIRRAINRSCILFCIFMALCGLTSAQSTDPANPTPITSKQVQGFAGTAGARYYYRFNGQKGKVRVLFQYWTNDFATQFEAHLLDNDGKDLGGVNVSGDGAPKSAVKYYSFDSEQHVTIVVMMSQGKALASQKYLITLAGAVDFGGQGGGNNPSPDLPDLKVTNVKISGPGGNTVTVFVSNVCSGDVSKTIRIQLNVSGGADKTSKGGIVIADDMPPLPGNKSSTWVYVLHNDVIKSFNGRYLRVDVDSDNKIKETIETNNWWETGAVPFPDPSNSCNPKSP
jgi:hypothetical protein